MSIEKHFPKIEINPSKYLSCCDFVTKQKQNGKKKPHKFYLQRIYVLWFLHALEYIGSTKVVLRSLKKMIASLRTVNLACFCFLPSEESMGNRTGRNMFWKSFCQCHAVLN